MFTLCAVVEYLMLIGFINVSRMDEACKVTRNVSGFAAILRLLYGYYQSRFGLIPRSRGGRWGLIKATVCSKIIANVRALLNKKVSVKVFF